MSTYDPAERPRVLHCITSMNLGGAERMAVSLSTQLHPDFRFALQAIQDAGANPVGKSMREHLAALDIPCHMGTRLPIKLGGMLAGGFALARTVRAFRPDLIHLHTEIPEASYATMVALRLSTRNIFLVRTIHNSRYWHHWGRIGRWTERRMPPAHVVAVSCDALAAYERHARRAGRSALSTRIIYNGTAAPAAASPCSPRVGGRLRLLVAGRFEFQKGIDLLPAILAHTTAEVAQQCELTVLGAGAYAPIVHRLPRQAPHGWRVIVGPSLPDLAARLGEFDLVLMPSRFEGFSLLAVETLMRNIPLVATTAPGLREAFPPGYPWLAAPGDAADFARVLELAIRQRADWDTLMEPAQTRALGEFSLPRMVSAYEQLYRSVLASS